MPIYRSVAVRAREAVLRDDLFTLRSRIDRFTQDNEHGPASLEELVDKWQIPDSGPKRKDAPIPMSHEAIIQSYRRVTGRTVRSRKGDDYSNGTKSR